MAEIRVWHPTKKRWYTRKFDHDEARARHAAGETIGDLAREYGVDYHAVWQVVTPGAQAAVLANNKRWRTTTCDICGGPAMRNIAGKKEHNPDGRVLCLRCRANEKRERLLFNDAGELVAVRCSNLDCANGERWQPPDRFTRGHRHREVREGGIHTQCRACQTRSRQRWRERRKVPCVNCGKPRLGDETRRRRDTGLCLACYRASITDA